MQKLLGPLALLLCPPMLHAAVSTCPPPVSHIVIDSGSYSSHPGVVFRLRHFSANLVPMGRTAPSCYAKWTVVSHAEIFVSNDSLTKVFAEKLSAGDTTIKGFQVGNESGKAVLRGRIIKIVPIDFAIEGPVSTDGVSILLNAKTIKADGIPIKALMGIIGDHLNSIFQTNNVPGVTVKENQISFSPELVAHLKGHIQSVEATDAGLILRYSPAPRTTRTNRPAQH